MVAFLVDIPGTFFIHHHMAGVHPKRFSTYSSDIGVGNSVSVRTQSFFCFLSMKPKLKFSANGSPEIMFFTASLNSEYVSVTGKPFTLAVLYEDFFFPPAILISVVKR